MTAGIRSQLVEAHRELMTAAIERDGAAQRALLMGDTATAGVEFTEAAALYRQSWEAAPPASYGRLVGMLKSAVLAGVGEDEAARYVGTALGADSHESATAAYARAIAALIEGDDHAASESAAVMRSGSAAFVRTADAIVALASGDEPAYAQAIEAIVRDFESRTDHLTGVAIADTAVMLERLAARRGISAAVESPLLP